PIHQIRVSKPYAPWLTDTIKLMMKERDKLLLKYKRTHSEQDKINYKSMRNYVLSSIRREKKAYLMHKFKDVQKTNGWRTLRAIGLYSKNATQIPSDINNPTEINEFFSSSFHDANVDVDDSVLQKYSDNLLHAGDPFS